MVERWFAAKTKPMQETIALENLARQNFRTYAPRVQIERLQHERITRRNEPLFPGYVLVRFALADATWRAINSTRGVISLLTFGENGIPTPLPDKEIESIQRRESAGDLFISEIDEIHRGDQVRVKFGRAADAIGTVICTRGERIEFLLNLLGRQTRVKAPLHAVEVIERSRNKRIRPPMR